MSIDNLRQPLKELTQQGLEAISQSSFGINGCARAVAYHDTKKDELIKKQDAFNFTVDAISKSEEVINFYGAIESPRLALQFVYKACSWASVQHSHDKAFENTWAAFAEEMGKASWALKSIANMQNIECSHCPLAILHEVTIRDRNYEELAPLLGWGDFEFSKLTSDWEIGAPSSLVLVVEREIKKAPPNFFITHDGHTNSIASRLILAMRLSAPGDVRTGRIFHAKPNSFKVIGGLQSSGGFTQWHPGPTYKLTPDLLPKIQNTYQNIVALESQPEKPNSALCLALRSFSSIYDRLTHQAEDRIVDAVTALEAIWLLKGELAFRLAFRTAFLLALSDKERVEILGLLTLYYKIRSKVVHGQSLKPVEQQHLYDDEPLRDIVRRLLNAFLHLANNPAEWTLEKFLNEADQTLVHTEQRRKLQTAMGIFL